MIRTRSLSNARRIGRNWVLPSGKVLPVISGGDDTADPENPDGQAAALEVPEDLTDRELLPDEQLVGIEDALVAEFDRMVEEGSKDLARFTELAEEIDRVRAEQARREADDAKTDEDIAALIAKVKPAEPAATDDDPEDPPADPPAEGEGEGADDKAPAQPVPAATQTPVTASAAAPKRPRVTVPPASSMRRHAPDPTPPANNDNLVSITAAADVSGFATGGDIALLELPKAMHARAKNLSDGSGRQEVATITRPAPMVTGDPTAQLDQLVASLTAPKASGQTPAAALVASGGWCLPAQQFLDLFAIEGTDAMFDLPTIGVEGGSLMVPSFIGYNAADNALWTWTAANDENISSAISNLVLTSNVLTVDTSDAHSLAVGDAVRVENLVDTSWTFLNGETLIVASVTDANTFTAAYTHANVTTEAITEGTVNTYKPCMKVPCPTWSEYELEAEGICLTHGNLMNRAWPAIGSRYVSLAMTAHERRMRRRAFSKVLATISGTDTITLTDVNSDAAGEILGGIDLATMAYRDQYGMSSDAVLEAVFPLWTREAVRATLARRAGVDMLSVPTSEITRWFTDRNVRPQFIRDYQPLYTSGGGPLVFPTTLQFLIYPAGGYFMGTGGEINLGVQRDSLLNATNDFTLAWMEEFFLVGQRGPDGRLVTVNTGWDGVTACCP